MNFVVVVGMAQLGAKRVSGCNIKHLDEQEGGVSSFRGLGDGI